MALEHRLQPIQGAGGVLVIDDTYNSNPRGAAEALAVLGELPGGKKVLVTPGMIELAEREAEEHRLLGQRAAAVCDEVMMRPARSGRAAGPASDRAICAASQSCAEIAHPIASIMRSFAAFTATAGMSR